MTIQRQYSLPNCRLVLEGWGDDPQGTANFMDTRPIMTILVNAECHIVGQEKPLSGGREFLEHLVLSVNQYAQQVLSGVPHQTVQANGVVPLVSLQTLEHSLHRLTVRLPQDEAEKLTATEKSVEKDTAGDAPPDVSEGKPGANLDMQRQIDLSTVQLFDLVEAIDQLVADAQTLPDIYLDLTPVPRRRAVSQEPKANRVLPAALGISGLAIAAVALFFVPIPEFELTDPEAETIEETTEGAVIDPTVPGSDPDDDAVDSGESSSPEEASVDVSEEDTADAGAADEEIDRTLAADEDVDSSVGREGRSPIDSVDDLPSQDEIEEFLTAATPIADGSQLDVLTQQLREQIVDAWDRDPIFEEALEYRVGVAENGDIVGFKFVNEPALTYVDEVPLLDLTYIPIDPDAAVEEPIGQFKVVFLPSGVVEVSPWYGRPQDD